MSATIDERVVEMRFDNEQFEKNVQESLSTIEKLKQSLKLDGAEKGFENVGKAADDVSFQKIQSGVEALEQRFSAMGIVGMRVLENITDSVMGLASKLTGFVTSSVVNGGITRAMNIENAHFQLQGLLKDEEKVQAVMDDAMDSVDGTAYAYDEAAKAASQFAASGMEAGEEMESALRGITGVAAMTNSEYESISQIFTTVAGNGRLMGDQLLQLSSRGLNAAATIADYLTKVGDGAKVTESEVREMVSDGEISFQIFAAAMDDAFGEHAKKANETFTGAMSNVKASLARIGAEFVSPLVEQNGALVKLFNTLRERINDVKAAIGPLADLFVDGVTAMAEKLTDFLSKLDVGSFFEKFTALSTPWEKLSDKITDAGISSEDFQAKLTETAKKHGIALDKMIEKEGSLEAVISNGKVSGDLIIETLKKFIGISSDAADATSEVTGTVEELEEVVNRVISGELGNGEERINALTEAGYDYATVQNLVNEKLKSGAEKLSDVTDEQLANADSLAEMSDEQLESLGYTKEQIDAIRELAEAAEEAGTPINELISDLEKPSGRELLIDSFRNALKGLSTAIKAVRDAWNDIFPATTADRLYSIIESLHSFSEHLVMSDEDAGNLKSTFKGLFAVIDIFGKAIKAAAAAVLPMTDGIGGLASAVLKVTGRIGELLVRLDEDAGPVLESISKHIQNAVEAVKEFVGTNFRMPDISGLEEISERLQERLDPLGKVCEAVKWAFGELADVISDIAPGIAKAVGMIADALSKAFHGEGFDSLLDLMNGGLMVGIGTGLSKFIENIQVTVAKAGGMFSNVNRILFSVKNTLISLTASLKADVLLKIAEAIAILAASLFVLSLIDSDKLGGSLSAITILFGELASSMAVLDKTLMTKGQMKLVQLGAAMVEMSVSVLVLASALKKIAGIDSDKLAGALGGVTTLIGEMVAASVVLSKWGGKIETSASSMILFAVAINVLAKAVEKLAALDTDELTRGLTGVGTLMAELAAFMVASKFGNFKTSQGLAIIELSAALLIMQKAVASFAGMSWEEIGKGLLGVASALTAITLAMRLMPTNMAGIGIGLIAVGAALVIIANVIQDVSEMSWEEIGKGLLVLASSLTVLAVAANAMKGTLGASAAMLVMATALAIFTPSIKALGNMSLPEIGKAILVLASAFTILGVAGAVLGPMVPAILGLSGALTLLGVAVAACGIGVLALSAGLATLAASGTAVVAAAVAALETLIVGVLNIIADSAEAIAGAVKAIVLSIVSVVVECAPAIAEGVLVVVEEVLRSLADHAPTIVNALMDFLIGLINAVADRMPELIQAAVNLVGNLFTGIIEALKGIDTSTLVEGLVGIGVLSAIMVALSAVAGLVPAAMVGVLGMGAVIGEIALILAAAGALAQIPGLEWLISEGGDLMQEIGTAIGKLVGGIVGGVMEGVTSQLPEIGSDLSDFMDNIQPFIEGAEKIDDGVMEGVKALAEAILLLTAADVIDGLTSWLTGGSSLSDFGKQLAPFGSALKDFSDALDGADMGNVKMGAKAGKILAEMADTLPNSGGVVGFFAGNNDLGDFATQLTLFAAGLLAFSIGVAEVELANVRKGANAGKLLAEMADTLPNSGGVAGFFAGNNDMEAFGEQLGTFADAIKAFSDGVAEVEPANVRKGANAGKTLAEMADTLPNSGGVRGFFTGKSDIEKFGEQLGTFADAIKAFSDGVAEVDPANVRKGANAGETLAEMAASLPDAGSGDQFRFTDGLVLFGTDIKGFSDEVEGLSVGNINNAVEAGKALAEMVDALPAIGGLSGLFGGKKDVSDFSSQLVSFGEAMTEFSSKVEGLDTGNVRKAAEAGEALTELANAIPESGGFWNLFTGNKDIAALGTGLVSFGGSLKSYSDSVSGIDPTKLDAVIKETEELVAMAKGMADVDTSSMGSFGKALDKLATNGINDFIETFDKSQQKAKKAAEGLVESAASGIEAGRVGFMKSISGMIEQTVTIIRSKYPDFLKAGKYLVEGFANGISENTYLTEAKAAAMANAADTAARNALAIKSPSKVFEEIGAYVAEGFALGIADGTEDAAEAAEKMAKVGEWAAWSVLQSLNSANSVFEDYVERTEENGEEVALTLEDAAEAFESFRDSVKDSIESATGLFDAFEADTETTGKELIQNLKSQIEGISKWASNIQLLASRGVSEAFLGAITDLGVSEAGYVETLAAMTDKQLAKLDKLYQKRLKLNDMTANEIAASFLEGGKSAAKAYVDGFEETVQSLESNVTESLTHVLETGQPERATLIVDTTSLQHAATTAAEAAETILDYGSGALSAFCDAYISVTDEVSSGTEAVSAASAALEEYGQKLYEESSYYEDDTESLKEHKKELKELRKERKKIKAQIKELKKENTDAAKEQIEELKEQLAENKDAIAEAKEQVEEDIDAIAEHAKEVFEDMRDSISDSVSSFLDPLKSSLDSGISLFDEFAESSAEQYEADKETLEEQQASLEELEAKQAEIQAEIDSYSDQNTFAARKRVKELQEQLDEVESSIEETKDAIEQAESDMASHSTVTADTILSNMQSQIDGITKWRQNLQELAEKGVSEGLLEEIEDMGTDGIDYVDSFLSMTEDQIAEANDLFAQSQALSAETLISSFQDSLSEAKEWAEGMQELARMGFSQDLLEKLGESGVDSLEYVQAFLTMTADQVEEFNAAMASSLELPDEIADQVIASYIYSGSEAVQAFADAVASETETLSEAATEASDAVAETLTEGTQEAGTEASAAMADAFTSGAAEAADAAASASQTVLASVKGVLNKKAGRKVAKNLLTGLKNGLADGQSDVSDVARRVAMAAYSAAKAALGISSPSKAFAELGAYADAGFAQGLSYGEDDVLETATDVMAGTIASVAEAVDSSLDAEPTIRPVLDLTDIRSGASSIAGMMGGFSASASIGLAAQVSAGMDERRRQSDPAADAIGDLKDAISDILSRPSLEQTNNFSITGDDPRAIADEVSHIIQQQVERRQAAWA